MFPEIALGKTMGRWRKAASAARCIAPITKSPNEVRASGGFANGSTGLLPPPALSQRCHRGLPARLITEGWRPAPVFIECPHPGAVPRRGRRPKNAPYDDAVLHDVIVVVAPSPETAKGRGELKNQWGHGLSICQSSHLRSSQHSLARCQIFRRTRKTPPPIAP